MPQPELSDSRFYMWRAVIALAHVHELLKSDKATFIEDHIKDLPLSDAQKETIRGDLEAAQSIDEILPGIIDKNDHADFFLFAQRLIQCGDNHAAHEQVIVNLLISEQKNTFNNAEIARQLRENHIAAQLRTRREDEEFRRQATNTGVGAKWRSGFKYWKNALTIALGTAHLAKAERVDAATNWMWQQAFNGPSSKDNITPLFNVVTMPEQRRKDFAAVRERGVVKNYSRFL